MELRHRNIGYGAHVDDAADSGRERHADGDVHE